MLLPYILYFLIFSGISCRLIGSKSPQKKLFLSQKIVTESGEFDGGVLVNEDGIIEGVLSTALVDIMITQNGENIKIIDAGNLALMAGVVDSHVHVNEPGRTSWEGYVTATQAAATGGITTIIDMPLNSIPPTTSLKNLKVKAAMAKEEVYVDVGFWGGVVPDNEMELHDMIRAGVVGFKCYLIDSGVSEFPYVTAEDLEIALGVLNGTGTVLAFHAELETSTYKNATCEGCKTPDPTLYSTYLASRPDEMELQAASLIASQVLKTDVHVHVVHVSAEGVVPILEKAREERIKSGHKGWRGGVTAETCNHYITLSSEQIPPGRTEYKCAPPIRNNTNKQKLWEYIRDQRLDLIASDHSPSVKELKGEDFMNAWGGISSVQFDLSLFWTEAKARGYSLSTVSHYLSAGPARLCGLQERKGALRAGLDADIIFFDPNASFVVTPEIIHYKNKISPYMNRVLTGKVMQTYVRGQLVYADGELIGNPKGKLLLNDGKITVPAPHPAHCERFFTALVDTILENGKWETEITMQLAWIIYQSGCYGDAKYKTVQNSSVSQAKWQTAQVDLLRNMSRVSGEDNIFALPLHTINQESELKSLLMDIKEQDDSLAKYLANHDVKHYGYFKLLFVLLMALIIL